MPSPEPRKRSRSRSPPRGPKNSGGGFRWKQKPRNDASERDEEDRGLKRGYRDRSPRRDFRDRDDDRRQSDRRDERRERDEPRRRNRYDDEDDRRRGDRRGERGERGYDRRDDRRGEHRGEERERRRDQRDDKDDELDVASKFSRSDRSTPSGPKDSRPPREKPAPKPPVNAEPMIIVTVNDRLGTKAQIPCQASDPIKLFKALVAAKIGRQPHEIMLKRQGERPFKDMLTLADYSVSNGVQLDLELDTGD